MITLSCNPSIRSLFITYIFSSPCIRAFFPYITCSFFTWQEKERKEREEKEREKLWREERAKEEQRWKIQYYFVYLIRMMFDWSRYIRFIFISSSFNLRHGAGVTERIRGSKWGRKWWKGSLSFMTELSQQNNSLRNPYRTTKINH